MKNKWEKACREWLKGCSCATTENPEECKQCTKAFFDYLKNLSNQKITFEES